MGGRSNEEVVDMDRAEGKGEQADKAAAFKAVFEDFQSRWQAAHSQPNLLQFIDVAKWCDEAACNVEAGDTKSKHHDWHDE